MQFHRYIPAVSRQSLFAPTVTPVRRRFVCGDERFGRRLNVVEGVADRAAVRDVALDSLKSHSSKGK